MLENALIAHGSPTLARLKVGSLFPVMVTDPAAFDRELERLNGLLMPKGVVLTTLRVRDGRALMYVYREAELKCTLQNEAHQMFLRAWGYQDFSLEAVLAQLRSRLSGEDEFPHEIGVFLGYPLQDVIEYIRNEGRNCLCCGCWKVYTDECYARRMFERFRKCREVYGRLFAAGRSLSKLTVRTHPA